jgi:uncharacterized protein (DUF488 family)
VAIVYTLGHSNRSFEDFLAILQAHRIETLVDIRSFPASRKWPWFNRESLERALPAAGIEYFWKKELGGRRKKLRADSPNTGLHEPGFRNYADYMMTAEFRRGIEEVIALAEKKRTAVMCAEALYYRCHRMLVSDWLTAHGHTVLHLASATAGPKPHKPVAEFTVEDGQLIYRGGGLF